MSGKWVWNILKGTVNEFLEDRAMRLAAALSYYSIFSLGPLLVLIVGLAGFVFGQDTVRREVETQLQGMVGQQSTQMVTSMMSAQQKSGSLIATIVGIVGLLIGASGVFGQLQDALNTIWEVEPKPGRGFMGMVRDRFLSFGMILGTGFLLLISLVVTTMLTAFTGALSRVMPMSETIAHLLNYLVAFGVITLLFASIFKVLPDVKIPWRVVWIGAIGTTLLFTIGKLLLGWYLGRASTASAYGAAGSIVVLLLWVYYSALILFFGAEFTQVYARASGARIEPTKNAVAVEHGPAEAEAPTPAPGRAGPAPQYARSGERPVPARPAHGASGPGFAPAHAGSPGPAYEEISASSPGQVLKRHQRQYIGLAVGAVALFAVAKKTGLWRAYRTVSKFRS